MKKPRVRVKKSRRFLSMLLSAAMLLGMVEAAGLWASAAEEPVAEPAAQAEEVSPYTAIGEYGTFGDFEYEVLEDGTAEIMDYTGDEAEVVIPSEIDGYKVTAIGNYAFAWDQNITSITISEGVTSIGNAAFAGCENLEKIILPEQESTIAPDAFNNTAYSNNLENWEDGWLMLNNHPITFMFSYSVQEDGTLCITDYIYPDKEIEELEIPSEIGGRKVTTIGSCSIAFDDNITSIVISEGVIRIKEEAFRDCNSLISITIPSTVTEMPLSSTIYDERDIEFTQLKNCTSLQSIQVDDDNPNYTDQDGVLFNKDMTTLFCYPAGKTDTSYRIPNSVTSILYAGFHDNLSLTDVTLPKEMTELGRLAFADCRNLTAVEIPRNLETIGVGKGWFYSPFGSYTLGSQGTPIDTVRGYEGSYAQAYAQENGYTFIALRELEGITPTADADLIVTATDESAFISNLQPGSTVADLMTQLEESDLRITDKNGNPLEADDPIGTGCVVSCYAGEEVVSQATVVVFGDTTGDGRINVQDISRVQNHLLNLEQLDTISESAVRFGREQVDVSALLTVSAHVLQMKDIDQGLQIQ